MMVSVKGRAKTTVDKISAIDIGEERKKKLLAISNGTGNNLTNMIRTWIVEKMDEPQFDKYVQQ